MRTVLATLLGLLLLATAPLAAQGEPSADPGNTVVGPAFSLVGGGGATFEGGLQGPAGAHLFLGADAPLTTAFSGRVEGVLATTGRGFSLLALAAWTPFRSGTVTLLAGGGRDFEPFRGSVQVLGGEVGPGEGAPRLSVRRVFGNGNRWMIGLAVGL